MLDASLFVSETVHEREITLGDGTKHKLYFREVSQADFRKLQASAKQSDEQAELSVSRVIARSMCNPDGSDCITVEQAAKLKPGVRLAISLAIPEVNGVGASVGKVLPPAETNGSGTSSS